MSKAEEDRRYKRHQDHITHEMRETGINFIGLGSVGSMVAFLLCKMGFTNVQGFDGDTVEPHNLSNQLYADDCLGLNKAEAFKQEIARHGVKTFEAVPERFSGQPLKAGITISAVDSKKIRREELWPHIKRNPAVHLYIDTRMGLEQAKTFAFIPTVPGLIEWYEKTLEGDGAKVICTAQTTYYNVAFLAGTACSHVARFLRKDVDVPPLMWLDATNMTALKPKVEVA